MLCKVKVVEEIIQPNNKVVYMDRHDISCSLGECDVPSTAKKKAKLMYTEKLNKGFTLLSCAYLSREVIQMIIRSGPRPGAVVQEGTVMRPAGVRKGKRIARRSTAKPVR